MIRSGDADSAQGVDIEMHQIVVDTGNRMMADDLEVNVFIDQGEETTQIGLEGLEGLVDVRLGRVFAVGLWVFKEEAVSVGIEQVIRGDIEVVGLDARGGFVAIGLRRDGLLDLPLTMAPEISNCCCGRKDLASQAKSEKS